MMEGLQIGLNLGAVKPLAAVSRLAQSVQQRFKKSSILPAPSVPSLATPPFSPPAAPAPRLFERVGSYAADVRNTLAEKLRQGSVDFAAARQAEGRRREVESTQQVVNIHFNPTVNASSGNVQQMADLLQQVKNDLYRELPGLLQRVEDDRLRRAY